MKKLTLNAALLGLLISFGVANTTRTYSTNNYILFTKAMDEKKAIETAVRTYIEGGDSQNVTLLETVLHDNYRVIINDTKENTIKELDKTTYLGFIEKKIFGGEPRKIEIESIEISNGLNASVKLRMTSSKATFYSQFSLAKINEKWWVLQDFVHMVESN